MAHYVDNNITIVTTTDKIQSLAKELIAQIVIIYELYDKYSLDDIYKTNDIKSIAKELFSTYAEIYPESFTFDLDTKYDPLSKENIQIILDALERIDDSVIVIHSFHFENGMNCEENVYCHGKLSEFMNKLDNGYCPVCDVEERYID